MISDSVSGSMGVIVNKPALNLDLKNLFTNFKDNPKKNQDYTVHYGGPVEFDKGFILHSNDYETDQEKTLLKNNLVLSSNQKILEDLYSGKGPSRYMVLIGYSGWSSHQLAEELKTKFMAYC